MCKETSLPLWGPHPPQSQGLSLALSRVPQEVPSWALAFLSALISSGLTRDPISSD